MINKPLTLDGPSAVYSPYSSACAWCKYFDSENYTCPAYKKVVPDKFLDGSSLHRTIEQRQEGAYIFTPKSDCSLPPFLK